MHQLAKTMQRTALILVLLIFSTGAFGQLLFSKTKHDFGDLASYDHRFIDVQITNQGTKAQYILSVRKPNGVVYIQDKALIEAGQTTTLRFQVNPTKKGKFVFEIPVFTSDKDEATTIKITGNLLELPTSNSNYLTQCPDFNTNPAGKNPNEFELIVVTIDKDTREELAQSEVSMIQNGRAIWTEKTDKRGKIKKESNLGLSYFYAAHVGYFPAEIGAFVAPDRNTILLELVKQPQPIEDPIALNPETPEEEPTSLSTLLEKDSVTEIKTPPALDEISEDNFESTYFDPINVVFVLDVSSSMNQGDKLELMKYALNQLGGILRPQDKIALVTYANQTQVVLEPTAGDEKNIIFEKVANLKASGLTAGGAGIKLGFKTAVKGFIPGGVNQVVVITDGAFNRESDDYKKYLRKNRKKGITMSVVGIKNKPSDVSKMEEIATIGKGLYIPINQLSDAQRNLKQAMRVLAFKGK